MKKKKFFSNLLHSSSHFLANNRILIAITVISVLDLTLFNLCLSDVTFCDTPSPEPGTGAEASNTAATSSETTDAAVTSDNPQYFDNIGDYAVKMLDTVERIREGTYTEDDVNFVRSQFSEAEFQNEITETLRNPQNDPYKILEHLELGAKDILDG